MKIKFALVFSTLFAPFFTSCGQSSASVREAEVQRIRPLVCTFQTVTGHYLTAVGGGGRVHDVVHTDATRVSTWEKFTLVDAGGGRPLVTYGIRTAKGRYLTAVGGGGRITDVLHSDATHLQAWEKFTLIPLGDSVYAIQTNSGHFLTANYGGGQVTDAIHSDATNIQAWEKFRIRCGY